MSNDINYKVMSLINIIWFHQVWFPLAGLEVKSKEIKGESTIYFIHIIYKNCSMCLA